MHDRVSTGGGCESVVNVRASCGWVRLRKCELLYREKFLLMLIGSAYERYAWPAILC